MGILRTAATPFRWAGNLWNNRVVGGTIGVTNTIRHGVDTVSNITGNADVGANSLLIEARDFSMGMVESISNAFRLRFKKAANIAAATVLAAAVNVGSSAVITGASTVVDAGQTAASVVNTGIRTVTGNTDTTPGELSQEINRRIKSRNWGAITR